MADETIATPDEPFGKPDVTNGDEDQDETYQPSTAQANHDRLQGLGIGQRDLDAQRDPEGDAGTDERGTL